MLVEHDSTSPVALKVSIPREEGLVLRIQVVYLKRSNYG